MRDRKIKKETESKARRSQETRKQAVETENNPSPEHNLPTWPRGTIGDSSSARKQASILRRTMASQPSLAQNVILQLQRQYGNTHVQRVLELARKGEGETDVAPEVEKTIERKRGGGQALDSNVRSRMESTFGADFSGVRAHTDGEADTLSRQLNARAFTTGKDIFFKQGAYNPGSSSGRELLAHELTHVVQQTGVAQPKLTLGQSSDKYEQEADQVAKAVTQYEKGVAQQKKDGEGIQRQIEEEEEEVLQKQVEEEEEFLQSKEARGRILRASSNIESRIHASSDRKLQSKEPTRIQRQGGPAEAAAAWGVAEWIGAAALGFAVTSEAVKNSAGDISWKLDEASGVLLPGGRTDVQEYQRENPNIKVEQKELVVSFWAGHKDSKKAGITIGLAFSTDGKGIGNISARIMPDGTHDWVGWGAVCTVDLMPLSFVSAKGKAIVRVTLTNSWVFSWIGIDFKEGVDSQIWHLEGDGSFTMIRGGGYMWVEHQLT